MYLLDANVLIDANRDYYPIDRVPEFWIWLLEMGKAGHIKIPEEIYEEIAAGNDELAKWAKLSETEDALMLDEEVDVGLVNHVVSNGYAADLTDQEIATLGRDPFLTAYAIAAPNDRIVVTTEGSRPSKRRQNRKVPDVCRDLGARSINTFQLVRVLDFRTKK